MTDFAAVLDPDPERRTEFLTRARSGVRLCEGLVEGEVALGSFAAVWAAAPSAPVDVHRGSTGVAIVWGDALPPGGSRPMGAADVLRAWCGREAVPEGAGTRTARDGREFPSDAPADGFHAALAFHPTEGLAAGADLLGLFPLYHWSVPGGVAVVASSSGLCACHPSFRPSLSVEGLAGVLLTGGAVDGRTLWEDVRRLPPGCRLRYDARRTDRPPTEAVHYRLPLDGEPLGPEDATDGLHDALARAVERLVRPERRHALLLSGGRDSRLLAAYLHRSDRAFRAQTLGRASDHDARCAAGVARALRVRRSVDEVPPQRFAACARLHARAEHLMGNASGLYTWGVGDLLDGTTDAVVSGHDLELACGGVHLVWAKGTKDGGASWEGLRGSIAEHALGSEMLDGLVRKPVLREAIAETEAWLEARFARYGESVDARARGFIWEHWARHHPGAFPWRVSFTAWPALPVLDQDLLAFVARIPGRLAAARRLQDAVLRRYHPALCRIPLVRPSGSLEPIDPGPGWVARRVVGRIREEVAIRARPHRGAPERRYYRRTYDLDGPGWLGVRRAAEPFRDRLHELFHEDVLAHLVPPPDRPLDLERPIADGYGRKTLLGLMIWFGAS